MPPGFTSQRVVSINQIKSPLVGLVSCAIQSLFLRINILRRAVWGCRSKGRMLAVAYCNNLLSHAVYSHCPDALF